MIEWKKWEVRRPPKMPPGSEMSNEPFGSRIRCYLGNSNNVDVRDYAHPFFLGCVELTAYPIILQYEWKILPIWLGYKTLVHWKNWYERREAYNRFLIGNILVIISSLIIYAFFFLR